GRNCNGSGAAAHGQDVLARQFTAVDEAAAQVALALAALVAVQVLLAGLAALQQARGGDAKALLRGLVRLHLGHGRTLVPALRGGKKDTGRRRGPAVGMA